VFALLLALVTACRSPAPRDADDFDAVVYGGTAAGVIAAVQLAELGRRVVLLEPTERIGGMTTCGLGATDVGNADSVGGLARAFYGRIAQHYGRGMDERWTFEPHVALEILESMLAEARVPVVLRARIADRFGADVADGRIRAVHTSDGRSFRGRVFLDASYEGDLLARAGVAYRVGREANAEFGETLNGVQTVNATQHQFTHEVDPYRVPGDPSSGLLPGIEATPGSVDGSADRKVQAYCFRLCTTDVAANRLPWPKPAGYDERDHELLLRNFDAGDQRAPWHPVPMPNRKTDTNNNFAVSTDLIGRSWDWPDADWPARDRLFAAQLRATQGLLWTLANHPRVPERADGSSIFPADLVFPHPPSERVSDVGDVGWSLRLDEDETNEAATQIAMDVEASSSLFGFEVGGHGGTSEGHAYSVSIGKETEFIGGVPPIADDPTTPEDEYAKYGYSFTPLVYRESYVDRSGKPGGYYVLNYAVGP